MLPPSTFVIASDQSPQSVKTRLLENLSYILKLSKIHWLYKYFHVAIYLNTITFVSGVHVSLENLPKARSIYLNRERQRAKLAASQLVMLSWLNTDNNNFGCTRADFWKEGINPCVYIMNQQGTILDAETYGRPCWFLLSFWIASTRWDSTGISDLDSNFWKFQFITRWWKGGVPRVSI